MAGWIDGLSDEGKASLEEKVSLGHSSLEIRCEWHFKCVIGTGTLI